MLAFGGLHDDNWRWMPAEPNTTAPLEGQKALVTGATTGLGRAIALTLGRDGAEVVVHGRAIDRGAKIVEELTALGASAHFVAADLGEVASIAPLVREIGDVDVLVNNAGLSVWGPTPALSVENFDRMFAVNVRSAYYLVAAIAPGMAARGGGSIVSVGSMAGTIGLENAAAYGATKAALAALTRSWAVEYGKAGVRINTIAPGPVYTRPEGRERFDAVGATTALKRAAQSEEIAETVAFLASSRASYITGAVVAADGGRTAI